MTNGLARYWPVLFALFTCCALILGAYRYKPTIETHHDVAVLKQVSANQWWMTSREVPQGFLYKGCDDFPNGNVIWPGYIARQANWEERGNCKSIRAIGLGFWWERDKNFDVKEIR